MTDTLLPSLEALLASKHSGRAVAFTAKGVLDWEDFSEQLECRRHALTGFPRRRLLLTQAEPLAFALDLIATLMAGHVPVIPPNFQPGTLANLEPRLADSLLPRMPALELCTSGSTGEPKRLVKKLTQIEAECQALEQLWGGQLADAAIVATVPPHHIYGLLFRLFWPLLAGRPFDTLTAAEPTLLADRLASHRKTVLISSPAHLARLPELIDLRHLHPPSLTFSSGGPLNAETARIFASSWGAAPIEVFGSTESGGIAWRSQAGGDPAWSPLPGVVGTREADGALSVRSPFLADEAALRLEDAVDFLPDGRFLLRGRLDRIVKIEEKRLSLPEMEARLAAHPLVKEAAIVPIASAGGRRTLIGALVVLSETGNALLQSGQKQVTSALAAHLSNVYDHVLLPRRWRFAPCLPTDERGKLPQAALAAYFAESRQ
ncbi:MAG: AMP-binding protein [Betaproteobacteria bacterium]